MGGPDKQEGGWKIRGVRISGWGWQFGLTMHQ